MLLMNKNTKSSERKKKLSNRLKSLAIAIPLALLMLIIPNAGEIPFINHKKTSDTGDTSVSDAYRPDGRRSDAPELDPNAGEYVDPRSKDTGADNKSKGIAVPGWGSLRIPKNEKEVTVDFYNPEANEGQYSMTFELRLPDESEQGYEVLYKSGLINPGLHIQNITLSRELDEGVYNATIHVQPYRMNEEKTATNNADMKTQLIVG